MKLKLIILLASFYLCCATKATTYYISPSGNDATGTGTITNPWKTLKKATTAVTSAGDIIHVTNGTYSETQQSLLAVGVSIEGEGTGSLITSNVGGATFGSFVATISATSATPVDGNQHISNLKLDGQMAASWGIWVGGRNNFSIYNCTVVNFFNFGVSFTNSNDLWVITEPTTYRTGNTFHDNIVINCASYEGWGRGCLNIGGQQGMLVYNNTIVQDSRPTGQNGWPIKYANDGFTRGLKIYNNTLTKNLRVLNSADWSFCMEIFHGQGTEIYGNTMQGSMDFNFQGDKGTYPYVAYIHDNVCSIPAVGNGVQEAVIMEYSVDGLIIENNVFNNLSHAICFYPRVGAVIKDVYIRKNLVSNLGSTSSSPVFIFGFDANDVTTRNFNVLNNTVSNDTLPNHNSDFMMNFTGGGNFIFDSLIIKNNLFKGFSSNVAYLQDITKYTHSEFRFNDLNGKDEYGNHNNTVWTPSWSAGYAGYPGTINISNNLAGVEPRFVGPGNYTLQSTSPLIDAGTNVGLAYNGSAPDIGYYEYASGGNTSPSANAGADQAITLPIALVNLTGSGTDPDGTISSYSWTKVSGPAGSIIVTPNSASTLITTLIQGVYVFRLTVTDNLGATGFDDVQISVNAAANIPPTANAGPDQTITLPVNTVSLSGSGADADGTVSAYAWTKISGPAAGTITNAAAAATSVTALVAGVYKFELKVTDNGGAIARDTMQVTVNAAANIPPTANAGPDQTITLPLNTVSLSGSGADADGTVTAYAWTKISGPAAGTITNAAAAATSVTALVAGVYKFELKVTDNGGAIARDTMLVTVNAAANIPPTANAGPDQTITLPLNTVSLSGSGADADGTVTTYAWTKVSGPAAGTITNAAAAATSVTGLAQGVYVFRLTVTDNLGATAFDDIQITVSSATNIPPIANAGADQTITLPVNTVSLSGSGADADGTVTTYAWTKVSGPAAGTITNAAAAATSVTALAQGVYVFRLTVTDNLGATAFDDIQITVNPAANIPPTANAGSDQTITLPVNTVSLSGSGTDADGTVTTYAWTKVSGPAAGTITNAAAAATSVTALVQGVYVFRLTVTDNQGATSFDDVQITVNPAPNVPPTANAGSDQSITLPVSTVNLSGSGTDVDGTITSYLWTKVSGPVAGTITSNTSAFTSVTGLVAGIYKFELKVTDNNGATDTDTMQVIVFAPNIPPVANAGLNQSITLPTNSATLSGSGTDVDGTVISYKWTKISGPATGTITNAANPVTTITGLSAGVYTFELKITDNNGATATDNVQVTVNPENIPPVANAGPDQSVLLPAAATLTGNGTDADGTIISYKWRQISGPADKLTSPNTAITVLDNLIAGVYKLELTVTDNKGATGKDTVNITAKDAVAFPANAAKVYPNPVIDFATVDINTTIDNIPLLLTVTDAMGKVLYQKKLQVSAYNAKERINMNSFAKGTYIVTIYYNSQNKESVKIIKF